MRGNVTRPLAQLEYQKRKQADHGDDCKGSPKSAAPTRDQERDEGPDYEHREDAGKEACGVVESGSGRPDVLPRRVLDPNRDCRGHPERRCDEERSRVEGSR